MRPIFIILPEEENEMKRAKEKLVEIITQQLNQYNLTDVDLNLAKKVVNNIISSTEEGEKQIDLRSQTK